MTIYFSFIRKNLLNPELSGFAGLENYRFLWEDPAFIPAIINSIILIGAVLIITVVLGTLFAVLFDREFFGKNVATLLVIAPFFVMPTVSALIWKNMMMHPVYGFLAVVFGKLGLPAIDWFSTHPLLSIIIIVSWEWLPFAFLILFTSIKSRTRSKRRRRRSTGPIRCSFCFMWRSSI
jgi:sorbitol/mannitol transport system permease protein